MFSTFDCNSGYWQITVATEDRDKTTLITHKGTFRHVPMQFGLWNAPATFQPALYILGRLRWKTSLIYLEDATVFSKNEKEPGRGCRVFSKRPYGDRTKLAVLR